MNGLVGYEDPYLFSIRGLNKYFDFLTFKKFYFFLFSDLLWMGRWGKRTLGTGRQSRSHYSPPVWPFLSPLPLQFLTLFSTLSTSIFFLFSLPHSHSLSPLPSVLLYFLPDFLSLSPFSCLLLLYYSLFFLPLFSTLLFFIPSLLRPNLQYSLYFLLYTFSSLFALSLFPERWSCVIILSPVDISRHHSATLYTIDT